MVTNLRLSGDDITAGNPFLHLAASGIPTRSILYTRTRDVRDYP